MALIALAADKGSPGVTTAAVALAAIWPRRVLLAETDPAGGDLVYRSAAAHGGQLDPNLGLLSIAATARRGLAPDQLWDHAQALAGGLDVLVGLGGAEQAAGLSGTWPLLGRAFAQLQDSPHAPADVIADCGRVSGDSPVLDLLPHAALVLLLARTTPESLARVRDRASHLARRLHGERRGAAQLGTPLLGVVLVAETGGAGKLVHQLDEMLHATQSGARVVGTLAEDESGAEQLAGRRRGRLDKSLLVRSARKVSADIQQRYGTLWATAPGPGQGAGGPVAPVQGAAPFAQGGSAPVPPQAAGQPHPAGQQPAPGGHPAPAPGGSAPGSSPGAPR
ncbi:MULTISPECIES: hypothetical protein [unclassified Streptomyces]|uniref:hypothetical protein n=1 Tax=unclassified Streptomyces TaxID=2593676 RepID=UPI0010131198|nr:hypothetical protein [Streptomyces sp. GZWMJZ-114]